MNDTEELQHFQHLVLQGVSQVTRGLRDIARDLDDGEMTLPEAASELRFLADAVAHKLRGMSE